MKQNNQLSSLQEEQQKIIKFEDMYDELNSIAKKKKIKILYNSSQELLAQDEAEEGEEDGEEDEQDERYNQTSQGAITSNKFTVMN